MTRPSILVYGNCQGEHLASIARHAPSIHTQFDIKVIAFHLLTEADWNTRFTADFFDGVEIVWNQVESGEPTEHRQIFNSRLPPGCQVVSFPPLIMLCLWPFSGSDPRLATAGEDVYPWADSVAASLAGEDLPDEALFERYMKLSGEKMPDLTRRLRIDAMRGKAVDAISDVQMWDWIEANFREQRLFYTSSHLTSLPFRELLFQLLARTTGMNAEMIARARQEIDFMLRAHRGQDVEMVPVHPLVADRLGLTWYDPDELHRWHGHMWTFPEYMTKYIRYEPYLR